MVGTVETKRQQLNKGYYETGSGGKKILVMGSCRAVAYITYFLETMPGYTIYFIDPFNWNWDKTGQRVDYEAHLKKMERHEGLHEMLSGVDVFVHEYYSNAGMFNIENGSIYQHGLDPEIDITLPNFNDVFMLAGEIVSFDTEIRKNAIADFNVNRKLSDDTKEMIEIVKDDNLNKLLGIIDKTSIPEFKEVFLENYLEERYWHTFNHVTKKYTQNCFKLLMKKYFSKDIDKINETDLFDNYQVNLTEYDNEYQWVEMRKSLQSYL